MPAGHGRLVRARRLPERQRRRRRRCTSMRALAAGGRGRRRACVAACRSCAPAVTGARSCDARRAAPRDLLLPGSEKTCSHDATPPFDEVGVPPTVMATYSLPPDDEDRRPARDRAAGVERPEDLAGLEVERAQEAVAAAREAEARSRSATRRRARAPASSNFQTRLPRRDVDRADRAVVVPVLRARCRSCRSASPR